MSKSDRKKRGLKERIYLLNAICNDNKWDFEIKGSSKNIYKIILSNESVKCACMDFCIRKKVCKHMHFLLGRVINYDNIENLEDIVTNINDITMKLKDKLLDFDVKEDKLEYNCTDTCCICFEEFGNENVEQCKTTCKNFFHSECINLWLKKNSNCPLCRSSWNSNESNNILEEFKGLTISN